MVDFFAGVAAEESSFLRFIYFENTTEIKVGKDTISINLLSTNQLTCGTSQSINKPNDRPTDQMQPTFFFEIAVHVFGRRRFNTNLYCAF